MLGCEPSGHLTAMCPASCSREGMTTVPAHRGDARVTEVGWARDPREESVHACWALATSRGTK